MQPSAVIQPLALHLNIAKCNHVHQYQSIKSFVLSREIKGEIANLHTVTIQTSLLDN